MKRYLNKKTCYAVSRIPIIVALSVLLFSFASVAFSEGANFKQLGVVVKPEYDVEKKVFLRFDGEVGEVGMPTKAIFYSPKDIIEDSTFSICAFSESNQMLCQTREKSTEGNFLKFKVPMPEKKFMFEGYFESLKDNNGQRALEYTFKAAQNIEKLNIAIAKPKGASNFVVQPEPHSSSSDNDGLQNSTYSFSGVKEGKEYSFKISYDKKDWDVSVTKTEGADQNSSTEDSSGASGSAIFIAILSAIGVAGAILFAFTKVSRKSTGATIPAESKGKALFCSNCGTRLAQNAKFCANCGAQK